ncbi:MAG: T9SS type A sorting domain-containing protein [Lentimicrobium sp.]|jgi:hypothetical protein|nr:T9SS type A sorting domain-containing protein [Lentimicrobium sp.]
MKNRRLLFGFLTLTIGACIFMLTTSGSFRYPLDRSDSFGMADGVQSAWSYMAQIRGHQATGKVNPADVINARTQVEDLKSSSTIGLNWTSMGPDNVAGRTRAILIDSRDNSGKTIFAGSVSGGLWKSTTAGLTWNRIETGNKIINVSCIAQSPSGDIYVGTGETFSSERLNMFSGFLGQGVYKSTDGNTFTILSSTALTVNNSPSDSWAFVNKIAAGANNVVAAATNSGLRISTDGGQNWSLAKAGELTLSGNSTEVKIGPDGAIAASVDNQLYISNGSSDGFALRSTGAGQDSLPSTGISRIQVAFAPTEASTIYAMLVSDGTLSGYLRGQLNGVFVSKDKGISWRLIGPGTSSVFNVFGNSTALNYGEYAGAIAVNPTNPDKVYIGGLTPWEGTKVQETGFYQWQQRFGGSIIHSLVINPNDAQNIYYASDLGVGVTMNNFETTQSLNRNYKTSMFYTVAPDDKGRVLGGSQGYGVLYLDREGNTIETASSISSDFVGGTVEASMVNPSAFFYSTTGGLLSRSPDSGESEATDFIYGTEIANINTTNFLTPFKLWESFNNGNSRDSVWFKAEKNHNAGDVVIAYSDNYGFPFKHTLAAGLNAGDSIWVKDVVSSVMFVGSTNAVYMSRNILDFGQLPTWDKISAFTGVPSCIAYSSDANFVYVGTTNGQLIRIANIALAYDSLRADVSSSACVINSSVIKNFDLRYITSVAVDPNNDNNILVTLGNYGNDDYVYRSTNALSQYPDFELVQGNLPKMPVYSAIFEMNSSNRVILGTEMGVFGTEALSANPSWTDENDGLGHIPVMMIRQQTVSRPWIENFTGVANYGAIYIATHGNGIYENRKFVGIDEPGSGEATASKMLKVYPNPVRSAINFSLSMTENSKVRVDIYSLKGSLVKSADFNLSRGEQTVTLSAEGLTTGTYVLQVTAGSRVQVAKFLVTK